MAVWHIEWCERGVGDWSDDVEDGRVGVGSSSGEGEGDILDPELKKWAKTQLTIFINWDFNWRPSWSPLIWSSSSMDQKPNRQYQVGFKVSINWKPSSVLAILKHSNINFPLRQVSLHFLLHPNPFSSFSSSTLLQPHSCGNRMISLRVWKVHKEHNSTIFISTSYLKQDEKKSSKTTFRIKLRLVKVLGTLKKVRRRTHEVQSPGKDKGW